MYVYTGIVVSVHAVFTASVQALPHAVPRR